MASTSNGDNATTTATSTTKAPAKKTAAKKAASKRATARRTPARGKVAVVMLATTHDAKAGDQVDVAAEVAEQLVERGHARKASA